MILDNRIGCARTREATKNTLQQWKLDVHQCSALIDWLFDMGWRRGHTHFWISSSLVVWHCLWTNSLNSDGRRGRLVEKRSSCLTNLRDEKLEQDKSSLFFNYLSYLVAQINFYKCMSPKQKRAYAGQLSHRLKYKIWRSSIKLKIKRGETHNN